MSNIIPANLLMGFGMGFIFVPLTTLSLSGLRNDQIGSGTGIQNLMRNVGGSVGISPGSRPCWPAIRRPIRFFWPGTSRLSILLIRRDWLRCGRCLLVKLQPGGCVASSAGRHLQHVVQQAGLLGLCGCVLLGDVGLRAVHFGSGLVSKRQSHPPGSCALNHETNTCHRTGVRGGSQCHRRKERPNGSAGNCSTMS